MPTLDIDALRPLRLENNLGVRIRFRLGTRELGMLRSWMPAGCCCPQMRCRITRHFIIHAAIVVWVVAMMIRVSAGSRTSGVGGVGFLAERQHRRISAWRGLRILGGRDCCRLVVENGVLYCWKESAWSTGGTRDNPTVLDAILALPDFLLHYGPLLVARLGRLQRGGVV